MSQPGPWIRWTDDEDAILIAHFTDSKRGLAAMLPRHTWKSIVTRGMNKGLRRPKPPARSATVVLAAKRRDMAHRRADPVLRLRVLEVQRQSYARRGRQRQRDRAIRRRHRNFFSWRAEGFRGHCGPITAQQLAHLWRKQRGLCALTGRRLDRSAELDHINPRANGGLHDLDNLQWVTREANRAKRDLSETEFYALCRDVIRWIGERIMAIDPSRGGAVNV